MQEKVGQLFKFLARKKKVNAMDYEIYGGNIVRNLTDELESFPNGRLDLVIGAPYEYFMLKLSRFS